MTNATLYIVATPIGNLGDITLRALDVLRNVDRIASEDTRHSKTLLKAYDISRPLLSLHEHNETERVPQIIDYLAQGESIALISDAGTPLISDPGYQLVNAVRDAGYTITALPGPSAVITALCVSGMPVDSFYFAGFVAAKSVARQRFFSTLQSSTETTVFYESTHRLLVCLQDLQLILGETREVAVVKELTKQFERVIRGTIKDVLTSFVTKPDWLRGEFVIIVRGLMVSETIDLSNIDRHLQLLMSELPLKKAVAMTAALTGQKRNLIYQRALEYKQS